MELTIETWHDHFANLIPKDSYTMHLENGEQNGLVILLEGDTHHVTLTFGAVHAVNVLDEGVQLNGSITNHALLRKTNFSSTLYLVENGTYAAYIKACMSPDLYEWLQLQQYDLVTLNYVVEIVTAYEPSIHVQRK